MKKPPIPKNEPERLRSLRGYHILDTRPDSDFDDVTAYAAKICKTPIALISLIDENRQWFKSRFGLDLTQTQRDYSISAHAILGSEPFIVEDTHNDDRFADNPLVFGDPYIRFYAGFPLINHEGYALGTICVIDREPRKISPDQMDLLKVLGQNAVALMELRKSASYNNIITSYFDLSPDPFCIMNFDTSFVKLNSVWSALLGWNDDELYSRKLVDLVHPEERERLLGFIRRLSEHPKGIQFENRILHRSGKYLWLTASAAPYPEENVIVATFKDTNQIRPRNEDANSRHSESLIKGLKALDQIPSLISYWDAQLKNVYANKCYSSYFAKTPEQVMGMSMEDLIGSELYQASLPHIQAVLRGEEAVFEREISLVGGGKHKNIVHYIPDTSIGKVMGFFVIATDITSLRDKDELENYLEIALDRAALVTFTDPQGKLTYANEMFCKVSGYSSQELTGNDHRIVNSGQMGKTFFKDMWGTISAGKQFDGEICNRAKNGTLFWVSATIVPFMGKDGRIERYISIQRDITREKGQQLELMDAYNKAEAATKAKSEFLSTMSHEIRTPLNGVIGMTGLLLESPLSPEQRECAETISQSGKSLLTIINDILDFSKIEAGKMELEATEFDLNSYFKEILKPFQFAAQKKGISLLFQCNDYPYLVVGDDGRIGQVLCNLVSNAIKFTKNGGVTVEVEMLSRGENTQLTFSVNDTGIGIPENAKARMFQAFTQAEQSTTRNFGGTGLGLSISKRLVEMMRGKIGFESAMGHGTTFKVELTLGTGVVNKNAASQLPAKASPTQPISGRILVAEDNPTNQKVLGRMLDLWGCKYLLVSNGNEVLDAMRDAPFDLILMDCQMPEMDGYTATRLIRASETLDSKIPIVALTANALKGDEEKCKTIGMNAYLSKPIDKKSLESVLRKFISKSASMIDHKMIAQFDFLQVDGMPDILVETIESFLGTSPQRVATILDSVEKSDTIGASRQAHALKSSARTLGAMQLGNLCQEIEDLTDLTDIDRVRSLMENLKYTYRLSCEALTQLKNKRSPQRKEAA